MIEIKNVEVFGWEAAIRGMRNPLNSWEKSDTKPLYTDPYNGELPYAYELGENDLKLMKNLSKAGSDHGKYLRMINVTCDLTAPLYWWKEFDTYKVGTVANSCSTMHKIHAKEFTLEDFSHEQLEGLYLRSLKNTIVMLNDARGEYFEAKNKPMKEEAKRAKNMKRHWWQMIQLLPTSYNQLRTVQLNYQVLKSMYFARRNHKLDEWREFCKWCETLPYFKEVCINVYEI